MQERPASTVARRRLVRGAAWSIPVMAVAGAAPALAVSCASRQCPTDISFGTLVTGGTSSCNVGSPVITGVVPNTTKWTSTCTGSLRDTAGAGSSKAAGFRASNPYSSTSPGVGPWYGVGNEAQTATTLLATIIQPVPLATGCLYRFAGALSWWQGQARTTLTVQISPDRNFATGVQDIYTFAPTVGTATAPGGQGGSNVAIGSTTSLPQSPTFSVPTETNYYVRITIDLAQVGSTGNNNDIYLNRPSLECV